MNPLAPPAHWVLSHPSSFMATQGDVAYISSLKDVVALDARTGEELWRYNAGPLGLLWIDEKQIIVKVAAGNDMALSTEGKPLWTRPRPMRLSSLFQAFAGTPQRGVAGQSWFCDYEHLIVYDPETGEAHHDQRFANVSTCPKVAPSGVWYRHRLWKPEVRQPFDSLVRFDGTLRTFPELDDGVKLKLIEVDPGEDIVVTHEKFYDGGSRTPTRIEHVVRDAATLERLWSRPFDSARASQVALGVSKNIIVVPEVPKSRHLIGLDPSTGQERWRYYQNYTSGDIHCDGELVYRRDSNLISAHTGQPVIDGTYTYQAAARSGPYLMVLATPAANNPGIGTVMMCLDYDELVRRARGIA